MLDKSREVGEVQKSNAPTLHRRDKVVKAWPSSRLSCTVCVFARAVSPLVSGELPMFLCEPEQSCGNIALSRAWLRLTRQSG
jgi:hypothetical protein